MTPEQLRAREIEEALRRVVRAWTVPGPAPQIHFRAQREVRSNWPALASAVEDAVRVLGDPDRPQADWLARRWDAW